jgi:hypothetical protein
MIQGRTRQRRLTTEGTENTEEVTEEDEDVLTADDADEMRVGLEYMARGAATGFTRRLTLRLGSGQGHEEKLKTMHHGGTEDTEEIAEKKY